MLNVREEHDWLRSVDCHQTPNPKSLRRRWTDSALEGLPAGAGTRDEEMLSWYRGANAYVRWSFAGANDLVVVNVSEPSVAHANLIAACNDSSLPPLPHVNSKNTSKHRECQRKHLIRHAF